MVTANCAGSGIGGAGGGDLDRGKIGFNGQLFLSGLDGET
jgi:hypothetical protein